MSPLDDELGFTLFNSVREPVGKRKRASLRYFAKVMQETDARSKQALPLAEFARFKGNHRSDENLIDFDAILADYDGEQMPMLEAARLLRKAGVAAILYTSPSH